MLFYRYISENLTDYINRGEHEAGHQEFDYAQLSDKTAEEAREPRADQGLLYAAQRAFRKRAEKSPWRRKLK